VLRGVRLGLGVFLRVITPYGIPLGDYFFPLLWASPGIFVFPLRIGWVWGLLTFSMLTLHFTGVFRYLLVGTIGVYYIPILSAECVFHAVSFLEDTPWARLRRHLYFVGAPFC